MAGDPRALKAALLSESTTEQQREFAELLALDAGDPFPALTLDPFVHQHVYATVERGATVAFTFADLGNSLLAVADFGLLGIVLLVVGFKLFEWLTPKLHVEEELTKGNIAVAIVVAAAILSVAIIVIRAIG